MDGIAGVIYSDVFQMSNLVTPMLDTMIHRGRSVQDLFSFKNVQLGVCGQKIQTNLNKRLVAALNGVILNQEALHKELSGLGHSFDTEHPSETLIRAFEEWGTDAFRRLQGDFAFMIFDQNAEKLYLVRDRIGKKPLYWYQNEHYFVFASDLKAILATGVVPQTLARDAIAAYFYFGYIPQDMSPILNVNKLLPAYYLEFCVSGAKFIHSYWSYSSFFNNTKEEIPAVVQNLDRLLANSVNQSLSFAKDPSGCFISGGLGSASVAYNLKKLCPPEQLTCFSVGFQGQNEEDIAAAQEVSRTLGISHECGTIKPQNILDSLVKIIWHLDTPLADPNVLATWEISKLASKKTNSVFSGMGSDELLAGHTRYSIEEQKSSWMQKLRLSASQEILIPLLKRFWKTAALSLLQQSHINKSQFQYLSQNALFTADQLNAAAPKLKGVFDPEVFLNKFQNLPSHVASYLYFDVKTRLPDSYLLQYERLTSAHGLDFFTPYLDQNIVEYMAGIFEPDNLDPSETGAYLKEMLKNIYPEKVVNRQKVNRPYFLAGWIDQPKLREVFQLLTKGLLVENGIISKKWLQETLLGHSRGSFQHLWSVLVLEIWYRLFVNQSIAPTAPDYSVKELLSKRL